MASTTLQRTTTVVLVILGALLILPLLAMGLGIGMMGYGGMMGGYGMTGGGWWAVVGMLVPLLVVALLVGGGYLLVRDLTGEDSGQDPALAELRAAYARGDLSDEEFERRRERLSESEN